jgi:hypothetical protein
MGEFVITVDELRARRERLTKSREQNLAQLRACEARENGFMYVLGELDLMIAELEGRAAAKEEQGS